MSDVTKLIKYLKCLADLHKQDSQVIRSIIVAYNYDRGEKETKINRFQDLAERMLNDGVRDKVVSYAEKLLPPKVFASFVSGLGADPNLIPPSIVKDYMGPIPGGSIFRPTATLSEVIQFFKNANQHQRYFIVVSESTDALVGIISVNDFRRNIETIQKTRQDVLVTDLPFFNKEPKVTSDTEAMEAANKAFNEALSIGRKITNLLIVDSGNRPVGFIDENDIGRWQTDRVLG